MQIEINTKPMTIDELIASHAGHIVGVGFAIDSESLIPSIAITTQMPSYQQKAVYVSSGHTWHLQSMSLDSTQYATQNELLTRNIEQTIATIRVIDKALQER